MMNASSPRISHHTVPKEGVKKLTSRGRRESVCFAQCARAGVYSIASLKGMKTLCVGEPSPAKDAANTDNVGIHVWRLMLFLSDGFHLSQAICEET